MDRIRPDLIPPAGCHAEDVEDDLDFDTGVQSTRAFPQALTVAVVTAIGEDVRCGEDIIGRRHTDLYRCYRVS